MDVISCEWLVIFVMDVLCGGHTSLNCQTDVVQEVFASSPSVGSSQAGAFLTTFTCGELVADMLLWENFILSQDIQQLDFF